MLKNYKHIIWDWNGTLFEDVDLSFSIMNNILTRRNMRTITLEEYKKVFTFPVRDYYQRVGLDVSDENWVILGHEYIKEYEERKNECGLYRTAVKTLQTIHDFGIEQSVLSAYSQHTLEEIIDHFGLSKYFIKLVGLDNIYAASKLENGIMWMQELGYNKGDVLFIGDTVHDYEVAAEIGADSLLVASGHQDKSELIKCNATVINSLDNLFDS